MSIEHQQVINNIAGTLFFTGVRIGFIFFALSVLEIILYWLMWTPVFRIGSKFAIKEEKIQINREKIIVGGILETDNGRFKFLNKNECIIRYNAVKSAGASGFYWRLPFFLKGNILIKDDVIRLSGRISLGSTLFFGNFLFIWTLHSIGSGIQEQNFTKEILPLLGGWGFVILIYVFSISMAKDRLLDLYEEFKLNIS